MADLGRGERQRGTWQRKLRGFMVWLMVGLGAFFFIATMVQLYALQGRIAESGGAELAQLAKDGQVAPIFQTGNDSAVLELARWRILGALEREAMGRRYIQAKILLMARVWLQYLGFVTGMILALVGAAFILGRLNELASTLGGEGAGFKVSVTTASPGLVLATLGTVLMVVTLSLKNEIRVDDGQMYTGTLSSVIVPNGPPPALTVPVRDVPEPDSQKIKEAAEKLLKDRDKR